MDAILRLAAALGEQHAALGSQIKEALRKLCCKHLSDKASFEEMKQLHRSHQQALLQLLGGLPPPSLTKIVKRIDPHNPASKTMAKDAALAHIGALLGGKFEPAAAPLKGPKVVSKPKEAKIKGVSFAEAVRIVDATARMAALKSLSVAVIKSGIKAENMHADGVAPGAGKENLISHIEKALRMGWPGPLDVMALGRR